MKKISLIIGLCTTVFVVTSWTIIYSSSSPCDAPLVGGHTGAPGETSCSGCHAGTDNSGAANITFSIASGITQYAPGQVYSVTVSITQIGIDKMGFSCLALKNSNNTTIGNFQLTDAIRTRTYTDGSRNYVSHKPCAADVISIGFNEWSFKWQAPATNEGNITLYLGALASNHNHATTGDFSYTRSITLTPSILSSLSEIHGEDKKIITYPNPTLDQFTINFNTPSNTKIEIDLYNLQGEKIKNLTTKICNSGFVSETFSIEDLNLEAGIYFIKAVINQKQYTQKLIIN
jgi:hypothetical protein